MGLSKKMPLIKFLDTGAKLRIRQDTACGRIWILTDAELAGKLHLRTATATAETV